MGDCFRSLTWQLSVESFACCSTPAWWPRCRWTRRSSCRWRCRWTGFRSGEPSGCRPTRCPWSPSATKLPHPNGFQRCRINPLRILCRRKALEGITNSASVGAVLRSLQCTHKCLIKWMKYCLKENTYEQGFNPGYLDKSQRVWLNLQAPQISRPLSQRQLWKIIG